MTTVTVATTEDEWRGGMCIIRREAWRKLDRKFSFSDSSEDTMWSSSRKWKVDNERHKCTGTQTESHQDREHLICGLSPATRLAPDSLHCFLNCSSFGAQAFHSKLKFFTFLNQSGISSPLPCWASQLFTFCHPHWPRTPQDLKKRSQS